MSFKIEHGLFKFDFTDHHAILGVPLDAEFNDIRKRYMKIARSLHPDSFQTDNPSDKQMASQIFSKLVNPAYAKLSSDRNRAEHDVLLGMMGKRLVQERDKIQVKSQAATELMKSRNLDEDYKKAIAQIAKDLYHSLSGSKKQIAQLSELNLVYLLRKESEGGGLGKKKRATAQPQAQPDQSDSPPSGESEEDTNTSQTSPKSAKIADYCRRAEEFMEAGNLTQTVVELKEALKLDPKNSQIHGLLGMAYVKQNQITMAKVHINQALKLNPQESMANEAKKELVKQSKKSAKKQEKGSALAGFLNNLFGGKKK